MGGCHQGKRRGARHVRSRDGRGGARSKPWACLFRPSLPGTLTGIAGRTMMKTRPPANPQNRAGIRIRPSRLLPWMQPRPAPGPLQKALLRRRPPHSLNLAVFDSPENPIAPFRHLTNKAVFGMVTVGNYPDPGQSKLVIYCVISAVAGVEASPQRRKSHDGT